MIGNHMPRHFGDDTVSCKYKTLFNPCTPTQSRLTPIPLALLSLGLPESSSPTFQG